jgi:AMP-binding enzyme C-terminal domain
VRDVAVIGVPGDEWGQRIEAVVVPVAGRTVDQEALRAFVRGRLRGSKTPDRVHLVRDLPRTETGKLIRRQVGALVARRQEEGSPAPGLPIAVTGRPQQCGTGPPDLITMTSVPQSAQRNRSPGFVSVMSCSLRQPATVIVDGVRTPVGKRRGALAGQHAVDLCAHVLTALADIARLKPERRRDRDWPPAWRLRHRARRGLRSAGRVPRREACVPGGSAATRLRGQAPYPASRG